MNGNNGGMYDSFSGAFGMGMGGMQQSAQQGYTFAWPGPGDQFNGGGAGFGASNWGNMMGGGETRATKGFSSVFLPFERIF